jgi:hypothetical protein
MTTNNQIMDDLYAQFPQEMEKVRVVAGVELVYLPVSEVINRLNRVFGVDGWSFEIISVQRDQFEQDEIIAHVSMTAFVGDRHVTRHGFGGQSIKRSKKDQKPVDLGNDFKGAVSDALKKAAQLFGIGLYLARSSDALDAEEAILASGGDVVIQNAAPTAPSENDALWLNFVEVTKSLTAEQKAMLNDFWSSYSGGRPKPNKSSASEDDIQALIAEAVRIRFDGAHAG